MARGQNPFTAVGTPEKRQTVLLAALLAVMMVFAGRLIYVQAIIGPSLAQAALDGRTRTYTLTGARGDILDARGTVLATTVETYTVAVDQRQIPDFRLYDEEGEEVVSYGAAAAAQVLAPVLGVDANVLGAQLVGEDGYHVLARDVSPELWQQIAALGVNGVYSEDTFERVYPNGATAGNILGWVNADGDGAAGIEQTQNSDLLGTDGQLQVEIGASGQVIPTGQQTTTPAMPGCDVQLTIDADIQWHTQQVIDDAVDTYGASWGAVVVIERSTGRIIALADSDSVDPNNPGASAAEDRGARSVTSPYEPGSTGKVLTILSALEEGVITPTSPIEDPYRLTTDNGQTFRDHTEHPDQVLTPAGVLAESANTGTVNIGSLMSDATRYEYMQRLGWAEATGIGLPGESGGILAAPDDWDGRQRFTTMFGQGVAVTLLQNTGVFATIANDGVHITPRLVDGYDCDGEFITNEPAEPEQVVSPESSEQMIRMLESVVGDDGTGEHAAIEGYRIAGKTGTAQVADETGELNDVAASFVGIAPADDPDLAVGVVIYNPSSGIYGGTIAAPVFHDVTAFALQSRGVAPSTEPADPYPLTPDAS
ncbi:peptidoglycan D,D-transpeptidase FtsI family protein [Occultella gossypii]|uniref:Penicillin-binding protein 2 n=1 Tax=Occultella gossypii TaxID=2800820 RepID=A0ABS7SFX1_9MICO|nr:penicillin-binding protein 2 [Occultella gossypii]MBZ2199247.1 penicillin-binding protein 2 [Occultella gossypii]